MMKRYILLFIGLLLFGFLQAQNSGSSNLLIHNDAVRSGVGLGSVIAVVASWSRNNSILWAILHGILSWLYVIYFAITRD
ncbi:MAG: hypothetical protein JNK41_05065 [Saprospiraceae bacterium]|jgi:hypothetical protein|nr:hypothetical protein [Saprospiraceae bacterium]